MSEAKQQRNGMERQRISESQQIIIARGRCNLAYRPRQAPFFALKML